MVCSHCHEPGHTYRTCPHMSEEEKKAKQEEIKQKNLDVERRRREREERRQQAVQRSRERQQRVERERPLKTSYIISNPMDYEIAIYWGNNFGDQIKLFGYCSPHSSYDFSCLKNSHRIVAIPFLEVCNHGPDAQRVIQLSNDGSRTVPYTTVFDMKMIDFDGTDIIIDKQYVPPKTEIDEWKEVALKSKYLLDQMFMLTGGTDKDGNVTKKEFENIAPILDMIQDIKMPQNCSEVDKERAGVPSTLTNIT